MRDFVALLLGIGKASVGGLRAWPQNPHRLVLLLKDLKVIREVLITFLVEEGDGVRTNILHLPASSCVVSQRGLRALWQQMVLRLNSFRNEIQIA